MIFGGGLLCCVVVGVATESIATFYKDELESPLY